MKPFKVLFVCWGNICRSPAAQCVFHHKIKQQGLESRIFCDSAGTMGMHAGDPPDRRMREAAARRDIPFFGKSRKFTEADFSEFDLILAMDHQNFADLQAGMPGGELKAEIKLFGHFVDEKRTPEVPDPYYGGDQGFEKVLDMVERGCDRLIEYILSR